MSDGIPEVNAQRRRRGSKPSSQAAQPTRPSQQPKSSGSSYSGQTTPTGSSSSQGGYTGGTGSSSGLGGLAGLGSLLGGLTGGGGTSGTSTSGRKSGCSRIIIIVVLLVVMYFLFRSCGSGGSLFSTVPEVPSDNSVGVTQPTSVPSTRVPSPTRDPNAPKGENSWLVMLYQDADDAALERDIMVDLNEAELIGSVEGQVTIVSQIDRNKGGYTGDGNWTSTRRYLVTYDDDLNNLGSEMIMDLGELNMGDANTLIDFVDWASRTYPSENYVLIMSDHGMGWPGGWSDPAPAQRESNSPLSNGMQDNILYLNEIQYALAQIQAKTNIDMFELIGMDACLMGQMEVYAALQPYARYVVASEETEPGVGWAYTAFLSLLVYDPTISTADLAANIVDSYITQDQRVIDDQARAEFVAENSSGGGFYVNRVSAAQLANQLEQNMTLSAVDLGQFAPLNDAFNQFVYLLQDVDQRSVAKARTYAQSYTSIFGNQVPPSYLDLGHFVALAAKESGSSQVRQAGNQVLAALDNFVIAEKHGPTKQGSTGVAIYFPNSQLYQNASTGMQSYTVIAEQYSKVSSWDDFLSYHYTGRAFQPTSGQVVSLTDQTRVSGPGVGTITIDNMTANSNTVGLDETVTVSAEITGDNIGHIYIFTGYYDEASNSLYVADTDFLESGETQSESGVFYPVWPEGQTFRLNFDFEPILFSIDNGEDLIPALFNPVSFGATAEQAIYAVEGTYTFAESGETRRAQLLFMNDMLYQVIGFVGGEEAGAANEIYPNIDDTFTVQEKWLNLGSSGSVTSIDLLDGGTIEFNGTSFTIAQQYLPFGQYSFGFLVSDMDGQVTSGYTEIEVR